MLHFFQSARIRLNPSESAQLDFPSFVVSPIAAVVLSAVVASSAVVDSPSVVVGDGVSVGGGVGVDVDVGVGDSCSICFNPPESV